MTNHDLALTAANIRYLLAIEELDQSGNGVRCVQVAQALNITKPSVHSMVGTMKEMELVEKSRYGMIHLTERGKRLADRYQGYFETICGHFAPLLPEKEDVTAAAYALLSELSPGSVEVLCCRLGLGQRPETE